MQQADATPSYNRVFERLVQADDDIEGFIAYGLYKLAKREWRIAFTQQHGLLPSKDELLSYGDLWTETALQALRENAETALSAYARAAVDAQTPAIQLATLREGRPLWKDLCVGAFSALIYSVLLLIAAAIIQAFGNPFEAALRYIHSTVH